MRELKKREITHCRSGLNLLVVLNFNILHCIILNFKILYFTAHLCHVLWGLLVELLFLLTVLHFTVLYSIVLYCITLYCTVLYCIIQAFQALKSLSNYCITLYCTVLQSSALYLEDSSLSSSSIWSIFLSKSGTWGRVKAAYRPRKGRVKAA